MSRVKEDITGALCVGNTYIKHKNIHKFTIIFRGLLGTWRKKENAEYTG